jgi:hypothetical protein
MQTYIRRMNEKMKSFDFCIPVLETPVKEFINSREYFNNENIFSCLPTVLEVSQLTFAYRLFSHTTESDWGTEKRRVI